MPKVILGMGLPGSGKSTTLSAFAKTYGYEYIPLDKIRHNLGIGEAQSSTDAVLNEAAAQVLALYRSGKTAVIDGTFLNDMRKQFIDHVRASGVHKIHGLFIDVPQDIAWSRVQAREKDWLDKTPRELFDTRLRHKEAFPPAVTDGLDALFIADENGRLSRVELAVEGGAEFKEKSFL
jgi:predicted kinase